MKRKIPKNIVISIKSFNRAPEKGVWGITTQYKINQITPLIDAHLITVSWDTTPATDPMDTLSHELVHVLEDIFGVERTHGRRFNRLHQTIKEEFKL